MVEDVSKVGREREKKVKDFMVNQILQYKIFVRETLVETGEEEDEEEVQVNFRNKIRFFFYS